MKNLFAGKTLAALMIGIVAATFAFDADAQRRFGGGKNLGRQSAPVQQRQATPPQQQTPQAGNPQQAPAAAAAQRPGATPAAAPRSPWRGALMGLAAGLGIAALASYLGFGEALTMFLTALLIGMVLLVIVGFILRRVRGGTPQPVYGGAAGLLLRMRVLPVPISMWATKVLPCLRRAPRSLLSRLRAHVPALRWINSRALVR